MDFFTFVTTHPIASMVAVCMGLTLAFMASDHD